MIEDIKNKFRNGGIITQLLIVNVGLFAIQSILLLVFVIIGSRDSFLQSLDWLYFPSSVHHFIRKPWTILTYQFLHDPLGIFHILFNMLYLYFFGRILIDFMPKKYVLPLYFTGGIIGGLLFMLAYNLSPAFQGNATLVGASASILALVVAAATLVPDFTVVLIIIGPVKLKWIALVAILIDVVSISSGDNAGGNVAHLGGALTGFLFIKSYQNGYHWFDWWFAIEQKVRSRFKRQPKVAYVNPQQKATAQKKAKNEHDQKRTDGILDKIAISGYESLSKEDKDFLFKISQEN